MVAPTPVGHFPDVHTTHRTRSLARSSPVRSHPLVSVLARLVPLAVAFSMVSTGAVLSAQEASVPEVEARARALADEAVGPGFQRAVDTGIDAQMLGFQWEGRTAGSVEVRTRQGDEWGEWVEVHGEPLEGPDPGSREHRGGQTSAGPVWFGGSVRDVEVRVAEGELEGLEMHAIRSPAAAQPRGVRPAGGAVDRPAVVSRAQWGADESFRRVAPGCNGTPEYSDGVRHAVVHHTAGPNSYTPAESAAVVRGIYYFHTHTNGFCDIGYNFLVDRFGRVFEGRAGGLTEPVVGAHASGFNRNSTGVAVMGTFVNDSIPDAAYSALRGVLAWKLAYHGIDPRATTQAGGRVIPTVTGHRDLGATACPGDRLYERLGGLRSEVAGDLSQAIARPALQRGNAFFLRSWQTSGPADRVFSFGDPGDVGLFCDWDGDGQRTVGIHRRSAGWFYVKNSNSTGFADHAFPFGDPGDIAVCGDWNGDGVETVGVARAGFFYLRNANSAGTGDLSFGFGDPGDVPLSGDWNGDGVDTVGVARSGSFYLRNHNSTGAGEVVFRFGNASDRATAADWNGDGVDTVALLRAGAWYIRNSNTTGAADAAFLFGDAADAPSRWR